MTYANDAALEVGLKVVGDSLRGHRLELARELLALKSGGEWETTLSHDWVGHVVTTAHHAKDTIGANVVGGVVVGSGDVVGGVATEEAVDGIGALKSELVGHDGKNGVIVTITEWTALILSSTNAIALGSSLTRRSRGTIEVVDSRTDGVGSGAAVGLWVNIAKNTGVADILRSEVVSIGVLGKGLQRSIGVLGLSDVPLGHWGVDVAVSDIGVGLNNLVHGKETIDIGVMEPEGGVEGGDIQIDHVATSFSTNRNVDEIVDAFQTVGVVAILVGADTDGGAGDIASGGTAHEDTIDTITEIQSAGVHDGSNFVVVAAGGVGPWATKSGGVVVPRRASHLGGNAAPVVLVERIVDLPTASWAVNPDSLVTHELWGGSLARRRSFGPVPEWHTESIGSVPPALLLVGGELADDFLNAEVPCLLENGEIRTMPGTEEDLAVRAEASLVDERGREVVPRDKGTAVNTSNLIVAQSVVLGLVHEAVHTEQIEIPGIAVTGKIADLQARGNGSSHAGDGNVVSTLLDLVGHFLDMGVHGLRGTLNNVLVVMSAMERGDCSVDQDEEGNQHRQKSPLGAMRSHVGLGVNYKWV